MSIGCAPTISWDQTEIDSKFALKTGTLAGLIPNNEQRAGVVEAGNASIIFPDENADPEKPERYRFGPTDKVIAGIIASGAEVYYRVGRSWGANINPPADFDKYANVVKHIAMHYNKGWANGFHYNIRYWEFWNEPEGRDSGAVLFPLHTAWPVTAHFQCGIRRFKSSRCLLALLTAG